MLFNAATILGFVAVATAAPQLHSRYHNEVSRRSVGETAARGITYDPLSRRGRSFKSHGNSFSAFGSSFNEQSFEAVIAAQQIQLLQLEQQQLQQAELEQELLLAQAIQLQLQANLELNVALDNIRINTFNNLNSQINTVAIVVTQIQDNRNSQSNNRYMIRQIQSNPSIQEQAFVVIQEASSLSINNNLPSGVFNAPQSTSTGFAQQASFNVNPSIGSYTPGASIALQQSGINLLPSGIQVPQFSNAAVFSDPALIVLSNQQALVQDVSNVNQFVLTQVQITESSVSSGINSLDFSNSNSQEEQLVAQLLSGLN